MAKAPGVTFRALWNKRLSQGARGDQSAWGSISQGFFSMQLIEQLARDSNPFFHESIADYGFSLGQSSITAN